jgi:hypothetical protein
MRSLNTHTREGGLSVKIVLARFAPSKNANLSKRANLRLAMTLFRSRCRTWSTFPISHRSARIASRKTTGWKRQFEEPIPLPRGRQLVTLNDAGWGP